MNGLSAKGYESYSHSLYHWKIYCANRKILILSFADYSTSGSTLDSEDFSSKDIGTSDIYPQSVSEHLFKAVCPSKYTK